MLRGQNQISHPPPPGSGCALVNQPVDKSMDYDLLPSPIRRVFYLSSEGGSGQEHEVFPRANSRALQEIERADAIVYGMGSLYTSVCPILCLDGMGEIIATREVPKIMCLNGGKGLSLWSPVALGRRACLNALTASRQGTTARRRPLESGTAR